MKNTTIIYVFRRGDWLDGGHVFLHAYPSQYKDHKTDVAVINDTSDGVGEPASGMGFSYMRRRSNNIYPLDRMIQMKIDEDRLSDDRFDVVKLIAPISIREFSNALCRSKYVTTEGYSYKTNNCVHAIIFALEKAGIHIDFEKQSSCKHLIACIFWRTNIITPKEFMAAVRKYKKETGNNLEFETDRSTFLLSPTLISQNLK